MSDFNSSLPVRTENAGDIIAKISDATVTSQQLKVNADGSIDVNSTISATDLDIRDLVFATDKVDVSGSEVKLDSTTLAALENISVSATDLDIRDLAYATDSVTAHQGGTWSVTASATDLDIRDLAFATDKVDVSGSEVKLDSTTLAALENITVSATNLDIRDLAFATDKVDVSGSEVKLDSTTLAALENITVSATDLDIRDLAYATDSVTAHQGGTWSVTASATDLDIRDLAFATDKVDVSGSEVKLDSTTLAALENITVSATDLDIRDLAFATDKVDVSGSEVKLDSTTLAALENITVSATDLDIRDLSHSQDSIKIGDGSDFMAINSDGSINVKISDASPGTEVTNYNTATIAAAATSDHTYTSTGNFYLQQISGSASGAMKMEVKVNGATKYVFFTSAANPTYSFSLEQPLLAANTQTVVITRTNRDKASEDVYTTISGYLA